MEQIIEQSTIRHAGWSESESQMLWQTAEEAQRTGQPLKQVFDLVAEKTGRRPNSIRNYYYSQVRQREEGTPHAARFVPFKDEEVEELLVYVLKARAGGQSVRACLSELAQGDHSKMLRYQNKYRSVIRNRPEMVKEIVERLRQDGTQCTVPEVRSRDKQPLKSMEEACGQMTASARSTGDPELIRACDTLARYMQTIAMNNKQDTRADAANARADLYRVALTERLARIRSLCECSEELTDLIKQYLVLDKDERTNSIDSFCDAMVGQIGKIEASITEANAPDEFGAHLC